MMEQNKNYFIHRIYTDREIEKILQNKNVLCLKRKCEIVYSGEFKLWAVEEQIKYPQKSARQVFAEAGFDMNIIDDRTPQRRLCSWRKKYKKFGTEYFINNDNKNYYSSIERKKVI